ncbi:unnamed protein product [Rotaria magnacalcarata]|uniref:CCR4-NOT transcription complex subunit 3 n=1 Tax=Rotaria magnacalcarata TaxID=392030 RepID=A0A817AJ98_9BILA|nr:unnamed protein product [Rotaria magnacalcarata]CAF3733634.1 unnamed protein product [Rotaria magnacalcarata]
MGDRRKLHGEIERCLKKVTEGVETFDDIWQKVHLAPNHNQKDRYEQELKKEIKKLQRLRDQIKVWMSSTEIKDKKQLQEARKNIEQKMEKFKIVERETKTKAYSKEGLGAGQKLDPLEKEKEECTQWITESIQELNLQIDKFEADIETLSASSKKKKPDKDKLERLEDTKHSIERHKFHIKSLEKILRAIDNDALHLKPIHNLRADIEYYIESNQESDFKENDSMYEEIDMDNLTTIMLPLIAGPTTQSHPLSLTNGNSNSLNSNSNATSLIDISSSSLCMHSHLSGTSLSERTTFYSNSNHGDNESTMSLTTPSSTQPSSPTTSPALPSFDDRRQHKSESEDTQSQRTRTNSGTNGSSSITTTATTTSVSHGSSPKNPIVNQQSSTKAPLSSASVLSASAPPHFTYPPLTTTQPVLQYSTIVSQNTLPSTPIISSSSLSKQQNIFSPQSKQMSRQTSINNNDSPVITTSSQSILSSSLSSATTTAPTITNSIPNSSHPPSLLTNNDRSGLLNQHILNNISQINAPFSSTVTLANGNIISSSIYSGAGPTLSNSNIPSELLSPSHIDSTMSSQQSSLLSRTISDNDRPTNPPTSLMTNGSSDGHSLIDNNNFANLSTMNSGLSTAAAAAAAPTSSSFLSSANSNDLSSTNNSSVIGHLQDNPFRYLISPSNQQQSIQTTRVPLTAAELRMLNRLNSAYVKLPSLLESERQRTNANRLYGRNPLGHSQMIPYYPQIPPTGCDTPEFYYRLAPDTLFFVFYYMEGSRAQYLAAKALKRQSWRFHTKHMMWFQRHEEPKTITDDYEQGTYIFFDYERWQTRKRDNFIFEYKFLEDREF